MATSQDAIRRPKLRFLLVAVAIVAVLAGCSSSDTSADKSGDTTEQSGNAKGDSTPKTGSGSSGEFPDAFPDDVPLPDYHDVNVISSNPAAPQVMLTIDPALETPGEDIMQAYADQLGAAGFQATGEPTGSMEAEGSEWDITFHSSMDGMLSIAVLPH